MSVDFDIDLIHEPPEEKKLYGVYRGVVFSSLDPFMLGRLMVRIPSIDSIDPFPLARMATLMAGLTHGTYFLPHPEDEVLVAFENGDHTAPVVLGCLWNAVAIPPLPSPLRRASPSSRRARSCSTSVTRSPERSACRSEKS